jgi:hypothetical protein
MTFKNLTLDVKKSNSSNETPNVITVGVENYGLGLGHLMEHICGGVCHLANVPFGEYTIWRMNHLANVPFGECTIWLLHKNKKPVFGLITQL